MTNSVIGQSIFLNSWSMSQKTEEDEDKEKLQEPPSCVRLGESLQKLRLALNRHNEMVCIISERLGV
jgi:hypothetical protein